MTRGHVSPQTRRCPLPPREFLLVEQFAGVADEPEHDLRFGQCCIETKLAEEIDAWGYQRWRAERMFVMVPAQAMVAERMQTFQEFPPRQKPASCSTDQVLEKLTPPTP